jgi:hypothetical protein
VLILVSSSSVPARGGFLNNRKASGAAWAAIQIRRFARHPRQDARTAAGRRSAPR